MRLLNYWLIGLSMLAGVAAVGFVTPDEAQGAQPRPRSQRLAIEGGNDMPAFMVRVSVDHADRNYKVGDTLTARVESERDGYLYLFNIDTEGNVTCLFPNQAQSNNQIKAKQEVVVPGPGAGWSIKVQPPVGRELLKAVVTDRPLDAFKGITLKRGPTPISEKHFRRLMVEAITGQPDGGGGGGGGGGGDPGKEKDKFKQQNFKQYLQQAQRWAEQDVEIITGNGGGSPQPSPGQGGKRVALFIGINEFRDPNIRPLKCCVADATKMEQVMRQVCGFTQTKLLLNKDATLQNIQDTFRRELVEGTRPGDVVFVYWSGHGTRCSNVDGNEGDAYDAVLVPHDGSIQSDEEVRKTMLTDKTFGRWVQELDGRRVVVILDTCHSGGQIEGMKLPRKNPKLSRFARGIDIPHSKTKVKWTKRFMLDTEIRRSRAIGQQFGAVLAACGAMQQSWERQEGDMGVCTYYLAEALQNQQGPLTLRDLYKYAEPKVKEYVAAHFEGTVQDPVMSDQQGQPVVLKP